MNSTRHMFLGAFIAFAISILGYYTLFLNEFDPFGESHEVTIHFPNANGLRAGDSVLVAGVRWGKVKTLEYVAETDAARRIRVTASLEAPLTIREGHSFEIRDATMLGGRLVVIDPGPPGAPEVAGTGGYLGTVSGNPLDALGDLVNQNSEALTETIDNLNAFTSDLRTSQGLLGKIVNDQKMADDFASAVENLQSVSEQLASGQGTIGKLMTDDSLYNDLSEIGSNLNALIAEAREVVGELKEGDGLLPRLLNDEKMADDIAVTVADIRDVVAKAKAGEGTLGRLLNDSSLYDDLATISNRLAEGEGTLGKLLTEDEVYDNINKISEDLAALSDTLRNGNGTISMLINDDQLYRDLQQVVGVALRSLEEYREAAPITTFTSVLFGAF